MNTLQLFKEIGNIDEVLISASEASEQKNFNRINKRSLSKYAIAACFILFIISAVLLTQVFIRNNPATQSNNPILQDESPLFYHRFSEDSSVISNPCCKLHPLAQFGSVDLFRSDGYHKNIGSALARTMERNQDDNKIYTVVIGLHGFVRDFLETYQINGKTYEQLTRSGYYYTYADIEVQEEYIKELKKILSGKWDQVRKDSWLEIDFRQSGSVNIDDLKIEYAAGLTSARINELAEMGYSVRLVGDGTLNEHQVYLEWIYEHMKQNEIIPFTFTYEIPVGMDYKDFAVEILDTIKINQNDCINMNQCEYESKFYLVLEVLTGKEGISLFKSAYPKPQPYVYGRVWSPYDIKTVTEIAAYDKSFGDYIIGMK